MATLVTAAAMPAVSSAAIARFAGTIEVFNYHQDNIAICSISSGCAARFEDQTGIHLAPRAGGDDWFSAGPFLFYFDFDSTSGRVLPGGAIRFGDTAFPIDAVWDEGHRPGDLVQLFLGFSATGISTRNRIPYCAIRNDDPGATNETIYDLAYAATRPPGSLEYGGCALGQLGNLDGNGWSTFAVPVRFGVVDAPATLPLVGAALAGMSLLLRRRRWR